MPQTKEITVNEVTFTLVNSMWADAVERTLAGKFVPEEKRGDYWSRSDFCYMLGHIEAVSNAKGWKPVDDTATAEQIRACYKQFGTVYDYEMMVEVVRAINELKAPKGGQIDKPDAALTPDEEADPNSSGGAPTTKKRS